MRDISLSLPFSRKYICISLLCFAVYFASAQSDPLEKRATLQVQKEPLEQVLDAITQQTGVRFSYNSQLVNPKTKVTINAQNKTVKEILSIILPSSVSYKKVGEHIVFYATPLIDNNITKTDNLTNKPQPEISGKNAPSDNGATIDNCLDSVSLTKEEDMKAQIAGVMMAVATASTPIVAQDTMVQKNEVQPQVEAVSEIQQQPETTSDECEPAQITFIYPLGTGGVKSIEKCYHLSFNILGGVTGQTKGFAVAGLYNIDKYGATGMQCAGIFNKANQSNFQAAGIYNKANQSNFQTAGIVNITKKGGFQIGLINVRDTADGVSLGLVNIVKQGGVMEVGVEAGEFIQTALTFRSGVPRLYTKISVGYNYTNDLLAVGTGLGTSFRLAKNLGLNLELTHTTFYDKGMKVHDENYQTTLFQLSPILNYCFAKRFKIYAGPTLNSLYQYNHGNVKIPYSMYNNDFFMTNNMLDMWIGIVCGIKIQLI